MTEAPKLSHNEEKILEVVLNLANALEAAAVDTKHRISELVGVSPQEAPAVKEEVFNILKFEQQKGEKLGEFEVAHKSSNLPDKWHHAYNILSRNNATIKNRYHAKDYAYSYWLYGENRIYRQKLKS